MTTIEVIEGQSGNAQLLALYTRFDDIVTLSKAWTQTAEAIAKRLPIWRQLDQLLRHAKALGPIGTSFTTNTGFLWLNKMGFILYHLMIFSDAKFGLKMLKAGQNFGKCGLL